MKKIHVLILLVSVLWSGISSAEDTVLIPYREGAKCGYADRKAYVKVKPEYDSCGDMINGIASVMKNGRYGFTGSSGRVVFPFRFSSSTSFKNGYAVVSENGKYSVLNVKGETVIPATDYYISSYSDGAAVVSGNKMSGLMGDGGRIILPLKFAKLEPAGATFYIAAEPAMDGSTGTGKNYLYNSRGALVFKEGFDLIYPAAGGFLKVKNGESWGYIHSSGRVMALPIYDNIRNIKRDGTACISKKGKWGIINKDGKVIAAAQYDDMGGGDSTVEEMMQADKNYFIVSLNGKSGIVSLRGEVIAPLDYTMIGSGNSGFLPAFRELSERKNGRPVTGLTLLDSSGWELFKPKREYNCSGEEGEGLLPAGRTVADGRGKLMGYINHQGEPVITMEYEEAGQFSGGFAIVKKNGLYGIIDKNGKIIEKLIFDELTRSSNYPGLFEGYLDGAKVYLDPGVNHYWK